ncbi:hypothetical protein F2S72_09830 [Pseudomonas syringae pv. actinidiae]|nr:hypothetical protein [Pseudomonas syringae pv. actinidiae]
MKISISNAKMKFSKAIQSAQCHVEIARAVVLFAVSKVRLKKLHPVRQATKRESVGHSLRASQVAFELATDKLNKI